MGTFETAHEKEIRELKADSKLKLSIQRSASKSVVQSLEAQNKSLLELIKNARKPHNNCWPIEKRTCPKCQAKDDLKAMGDKLLNK